MRTERTIEERFRKLRSSVGSTPSIFFISKEKEVNSDSVGNFLKLQIDLKYKLK